MKRFKYIVLILAACLSNFALAGLTDGWIQLGKEKVKPRIERAEFWLANGTYQPAAK